MDRLTIARIRKIIHKAKCYALYYDYNKNYYETLKLCDKVEKELDLQEKHN